MLARLDMLGEQPATTRTEALAAAPATLAVLPFVNFSKEEVNELLANGLTEELFGALERNPELRVTARSSAFQFKDQDRDLREVGQRLDVRYVLSGSVRSSADNVQVMAELLDIDTGAPLWSETYNRALADWFTLQQDIAVDVASAVQSALHKAVVVAPRPKRASNAEAQLELLRARQLLITRSVADSEAGHRALAARTHPGSELCSGPCPPCRCHPDPGRIYYRYQCGPPGRGAIVGQGAGTGSGVG